MHIIQQMTSFLRANTSMETDTISTETQSLQLLNKQGTRMEKHQRKINKIILQRENLWIVKLKTLTPHGFNQKLN